jgi:hypothetical protein
MLNILTPCHVYYYSTYYLLLFYVSTILSCGKYYLPVSLLPEVETPDHRRAAEIRASSADGLHRLRLRFCQLPLDGPPYTCVNIRYYGPQRFRTFDNYAIHLDRGGQLREWLAERPLAADVPRGLDDPRVFEHWQAPS